MMSGVFAHLVGLAALAELLGEARLPQALPHVIDLPEVGAGRAEQVVQDDADAERIIASSRLPHETASTDNSGWLLMNVPLHAAH